MSLLSAIYCLLSVTLMPAICCLPTVCPLTIWNPLYVCMLSTSCQHYVCYLPVVCLKAVRALCQGSRLSICLLCAVFLYYIYRLHAVYQYVCYLLSLWLLICTVCLLSSVSLSAIYTRPFLVCLSDIDLSASSVVGFFSAC